MTKREPLLSVAAKSFRLAFMSKPVKRSWVELGDRWTLAFSLGQPHGSEALNVSVMITPLTGRRTSNVHNFTPDDFAAIEDAMRQTQLAARGIIDKPPMPDQKPDLWERLWLWLNHRSHLKPTFAVNLGPFAISLREDEDRDVKEIWMTFDGGYLSLTLSLDELDDVRGQARSIVQTGDVNLP